MVKEYFNNSIINLYKEIYGKECYYEIGSLKHPNSNMYITYNVFDGSMIPILNYNVRCMDKTYGFIDVTISKIINDWKYDSNLLIYSCYINLVDDKRVFDYYYNNRYFYKDIIDQSYNNILKDDVFMSHLNSDYKHTIKNSLVDNMRTNEELFMKYVLLGGDDES